VRIEAGAGRGQPLRGADVEPLAVMHDGAQAAGALGAIVEQVERERARWRAIKRAPALEHIDVLVLSGLVSDKEIQELLTLGIQSHSRKPSTLAEFQALAEEIMALCKKGLERALEPKNV